MNDKTSDHYGFQWGKEVGFRAFVETNPQVLKVTPSRQLPWGDLFAHIRERSKTQSTRVYDAGCGFGDIMRQLMAAPVPSHLEYLGADIQSSLDDFPVPKGARVIRHSMMERIKGEAPFDFVICRSAMHHTPEPRETFKTLVSQLADGGTIAATLYARKTPMREAVDDALRQKIVDMKPEEAFTIARQFTILGRDLQECEAKVVITQDLPLLGIKAGEYSLQSFIYDHFIKCWFNKVFGEKYSDVVNFDWYHPPYAFRFTPEEIKDMVAQAGLSLNTLVSIKPQHYFEATLRTSISNAREWI